MADFGGTILGAMPFLLAGGIVFTVAYYRHARRRETEQTIRAAIEKGQQLDPALIEKLLEQPRRHGGQALKIGGIILLFLAMGLAVLHFVVGGEALREGPMPGAIVVGFIAMGLLVASRFTKPEEPTEPKLPPQT